MKKNAPRKILVCPLNWGAGHATRVQVVASKLKKRGHKVIIAAPPSLHRVFKEGSYDELLAVWSPALSYPRRLPLYLGVLLQLPVLLAGFIYDRVRLPQLIREHGIDLVISDNRFGMWSRRVCSVYITHQVRLALPRPFGFAVNLLSGMHRHIAGRYDECWIPDLPGDDNLSGRLSHKCKLPPGARYIGILSRAGITGPEQEQHHNGLPGSHRSGSHVVNNGSQQENRKPGINSSREAAGREPVTLALLSGPEPRRTAFEKIIISKKDILPGQLVIVAGRPADKEGDGHKGIVRYAWLDGPPLFSLMEEADLIICRPGYSTVMDLFTIGRRALLVATPGQPEQEYLAAYLSDSYGFICLTERQMEKSSVLPAITRELNWKGDNEILLDKAVDDLLKKLP